MNGFGKASKARLECVDEADAEKVNAYAEKTMTDKNRTPYNWHPFSPKTCLTFARDAIRAGSR